MTSSAPKGSKTPGPKTYGLVASKRRNRRLGSSLRDAGTLNPSGSRGVETRSIGYSFTMWGLFVLVVAVAGLRALAFRCRRLGLKFLRLLLSVHTADAINQSDISQID